MTIAAKTRPVSQASDQKDSIDMSDIFRSTEAPQSWSPLGLALTIDQAVPQTSRTAIAQGGDGSADRKEEAQPDETSSRFSQSTFSTDAKSRLRVSIASQPAGKHCRLDTKKAPSTDLGPSLDNALQYVYGDEAGLEGEYNDGPPNARRRGRAIFVNDQVQFKSQKEMVAFHRALLEWQDGDEERERVCKVNDCDAIILLAQARNIAVASTKDALDSPRRTQMHLDPYRPSYRRGNSSYRLETSASTPEGALGRLKLAEEADVDRMASNTSERLELLASDEEEGYCRRCQGPGSNSNVLRAGLRFTLACYDDAMRERSKDHAAGRSGDSDGTPSMNTPKPQAPQPLFRGQSIMKKLAKRRLSLTPAERGMFSPPAPTSPPSNGMDTLSEAPPMYTSPRGLTSTFFDSNAGRDLLQQEKERHLLQQERVKNAALEKELETIRAALNRPEKDAMEVESDQEREMLQAVLQAARDVAEAEENEGRWKSQCEEVQRRLDTVEEALYHALGLLAEKDEAAQAETQPSNTLSTEERSSDDASDNESHFYSAGEEDGEPTPVGTLTRKASASLTGTRRRSDTKISMKAHQVENDTQADKETWPAPETGHHRDGGGEPSRPIVHRASVSESNGSRRSSHASSAVRHTILPPPTPLPTTPLPSLPASSVRAKVESISSSESKHLSHPVSTQDSDKTKGTGNGKIIDYSSRARAAKKAQEQQTPEIITSDASPTNEADNRPSSLQSTKKTGESTQKTESISMDLISREDIADHRALNGSALHPKMNLQRSSSDFTKSTSPSAPSIVSSNGSGSVGVNGSKGSYRRSTSYKSSTSSQGREEKGAHASKLSILGHMPPIPSRRHSRTPSEYSASSSLSYQRGTSMTDEVTEDTHSPSKSPLVEHYEALNKERAKDEAQATFFARRTKFRQAAAG